MSLVFGPQWNCVTCKIFAHRVLKASLVDNFHVLALVVFITLAFEFTNGWHDAASSIATVVSTRVLRPLLGGGVGGVVEFYGGVCVRHSRGENDGHRAW